MSDSGSWGYSQHNNLRQTDHQAIPNTTVFSADDFALLHPCDPVLPLAHSKKTSDNKKESLRQRLLEIEARLDNVQQGLYNARRKARHVLAGNTQYDEGGDAPFVQHFDTNNNARHRRNTDDIDDNDDGSHDDDDNNNKLLSEEEDGSSVSSLTLSECWLLSSHHGSHCKVDPGDAKQVLVTGIHLLDDSHATR